MASRRKAEEAVEHLDDDNQRCKPCERGNRVLHQAIEAEDEAREQDGGMGIRSKERVVIVEDLNRFGRRESDRRRLRSRYGLDSWSGTHVWCVAVLIVVASVDPPRRGGLFVLEPSVMALAALALRFSTSKTHLMLSLRLDPPDSPSTYLMILLIEGSVIRINTSSKFTATSCSESMLTRQQIPWTPYPPSLWQVANYLRTFYS